MKVGVVEILFVFVSFVIGYVLNVVLKPKHKVKIDKISHDRHVQNNSPSGVNGCSIDNFIEFYHKNNNSDDILSCIGNATQYLKNVCGSRAQQDTSDGIFHYCRDNTSPPSPTPIPTPRPSPIPTPIPTPTARDCENSDNPGDGEECCRYKGFKHCDKYCEMSGANQKICCKWKNKCKKFCKDTKNLGDDKDLCCADCEGNREKCNRQGVQKYSPTKSDGCGDYCKRADSDGSICCGNPSAPYSNAMNDSKPCRDYCLYGQDGNRTAKYCCGEPNGASRDWGACDNYCKRDDADKEYCKDVAIKLKHDADVREGLESNIKENINFCNIYENIFSDKYKNIEYCANIADLIELDMIKCTQDNFIKNNEEFCQIVANRDRLKLFCESDYANEGGETKQKYTNVCA
jgi:hypothetical protein